MKNWNIPTVACSNVSSLPQNIDAILDLGETSLILESLNSDNFRDIALTVRYSHNNLRLLDELRPPFDYDIYLLEQDSPCAFSIYEAFTIASHLPLQVQLVETWTPDGKMAWRNDVKWERRRNLRGIALRLIASTTVTEESTGQETFLADYFVQELAMRLNFTIEYVQPNLSLSHNEALMSMDYFDADIYGITLLSPSTARKEHVDFTKTIYSSYQRFFKRELGVSKTDYFIMLSRDLWLAILLALLILALYALCQSRTNAYENNLLYIGIICLSISQSYDISLRYSVSFKILIFTSSLFCFMLITVF